MSADGNDISISPEDVLKQVAAVCSLMAEGMSLKNACALPGMPARSTFYFWMSNYRDVLDMYTRAREERADLYADEIIDIADAPLEMLPDDDKEATEEDKAKARKALEQRRQMIDARKWAAAKLNPKVYSERQNLDVNANVKVSHEAALQALE